jgi:hypothetical protein
MSRQGRLVSGIDVVMIGKKGKEERVNEGRGQETGWFKYVR